MKIFNSELPSVVNKIIFPCLGILFMGIESGKNYEISLYILGLLSGALMSCIAYYFGSSTGSKEKSKELQDLMDKGKPKL